MSGKLNNLRRRLSALHDAAKDTFAGRFAALTPSQKAEYADWKQRTADFHRSNPGAYSALRNGGGGPPELPRSIAEKLYRPAPVITADMTDEQAAEVYHRFVQEGR